MKIDSRDGIDGTPNVALMIHNSEELSFNIALFDRMSYSGGYQIFEQINGYWSYIQPSVQDKIFNIYKQIREVYDSVWDVNELTIRLHALVKELFELHLLDDIHHWTWFHSNALLPDGLRESFKDSHETPGTRERTYLKDDYKWLVSLSISLRIMIPIWGEFIARTKKNNTVFKEYYAFLLLSHSNLINSEPMERLRVYVEHSLPADKSISSAIYGGIDSGEFPTWVLGLVTVRRLSIGDVRGVDPTSSLVTFIYKYIGQKVKSHDNSFIGRVNDKRSDSESSDSENNLSKLEGYKIKQAIPAGDIAIISYYLENTHNLAIRVCPDIDLNLVDITIQSVKVLENKQIWTPQRTLAQWVMKKVIPPNSLLHIKKIQVLDVLGIATAVLWHKGYFELAGLLCAINQDNTTELSIGGTDSRSRITKEQLEQLEIYYPYTRKPVGKQKILKKINPAVESIESTATMFSEHDWILTLPGYMVEKITGNGNNTRYSVPFNIKNTLCDLALSLAKREF